MRVLPFLAQFNAHFALAVGVLLITFNLVNVESKKILRQKPPSERFILANFALVKL